MAPKQPCVKYQYIVTPSGPKILPVDEPSCKDEESPADYNAGGYLPVKLNDSFKNGRYRVIRKLGWGHFSTVWLVKDLVKDRHSALKVVKSAGRYAETARDEIKLLSQVSSISPTHPGRSHIVSFLDSFAHQGPEASHVCIVFEPLGENLLGLIERHKKKGVPRALVKLIAKQILLGLQYLHDECDLVHTDIKPENILIAIPDIEAHIFDELSNSPTPTSRRVGVPLPNKSRAGVSIPQNQLRARRQVQIFDSQPLSSPSRQSGLSARPNGSNSGSNSASGSYVAQMRMTAGNPPITFISSSLTSAVPKLPVSDLSASVSRSEPLPAVKSPLKPDTPSTSSSSSSISSTLASTTAGSSSIVSTPPTSLSHSLGNGMSGFMTLGKTTSKPRSADQECETVGLPMPIKIRNNHSDTSSSWKESIATSWKEKLSTSLKSTLSIHSKTRSKQLAEHGHSRSQSGKSISGFWKDPGASAPAPALLVSAVVGADGEAERGDYFRLASGSSTSVLQSTHSESSSSTATVARPTPIGTPQLPNGNLPHNIPTKSQSPLNPTPSLLTQTAPSRIANNNTLPRTHLRASPPQHISQLSAHMHTHAPSSSSQNPIDIPTTRQPSKISIANHKATASSPTSLTPTPTSPTLAAPPPTPSDSPQLSFLPSQMLSVLGTAGAAIAIPSVASSGILLNEITSTTAFPSFESQYSSPSVDPPIAVKIADLGNATPSTKHYTEDIQTRQYRAPEAILGRKDWDARADIWSVACVVFELLTAEYLFDPQGQGELFTKDDDHMAQIIELLGDFDIEVKMGGKFSRELFDHSGALRYIRTLKPWPLRRVMTEKYLYADKDATLLCEFLEPMLRVDMRQRSHARDILDKQWLTVTEEDGDIGEW